MNLNSRSAFYQHLSLAVGGWIRDEKDAALVMTVIIPLASSNLAAANIVKTLSIRFEFDVGIHTIIDLVLLKS